MRVPGLNYVLWTLEAFCGWFVPKDDVSCPKLSICVQKFTKCLAGAVWYSSAK